MAGPTFWYGSATRCFPSGDQRAENIFSDPGTVCTRPLSRSMIETCRSCFGTTSSPYGAKTSFFPSGDQFGSKPGPLAPFTGSALPPAAGIVKIRCGSAHTPFLIAANARRLPSGDQRGIGQQAVFQKNFVGAVA